MFLTAQVSLLRTKNKNNSTPLNTTDDPFIWGMCCFNLLHNVQWMSTIIKCCIYLTTSGNFNTRFTDIQLAPLLGRFSYRFSSLNCNGDGATCPKKSMPVSLSVTWTKQYENCPTLNPSADHRGVVICAELLWWWGFYPSIAQCDDARILLKWLLEAVSYTHLRAHET